jgi:hypothetical protein
MTDQLKKILVFLFILTLALSFPDAEAKIPQKYTLANLVRNADVIIEGNVLDQSASSKHGVNVQVGQAGYSVTPGFGNKKESSVLVTKVCKGNLKEGDVIRVFSEFTSRPDHSDLKAHKQYVLFLNQHKSKLGYVIASQGRGEWLVFQMNGVKKVKAWHQMPVFRQDDQYQDYEGFLAEVITHISADLSVGFSNDQNHSFLFHRLP